ncbi:hypothetical protein DZC78_14590 [Olleya aquimaris]|uniref:YcxB-like protein domain-containing protein n=1 Tax=Olleya sediminilitoris TaxID=2795739 RepID=A0ABS1WKL4_9FLAO|nr:hypothetical protein [Olleya sediminilitoris]AXO81561.1 hypothetical protein DZC78_14590 [Olleya aquimaris]MBL7559661.1 hypothetical protein [Olleya sediminilitoris]
MKVTFNDQKHFITEAIKPHLGLLGIWLIFIVFGSFFIYLGNHIEQNGIGFVIFGYAFIVLASTFILFTLPSSIMYYYEKAKVKKYGSYTFARITNKRIDDYSHTNSSTFDSSKSKVIKEFLYVVEFEFNYNNTTFTNECFFEHKTTFETITLTTKLPIQFLKTNPKKVTLRRRKLSNQLNIPEKLCQ